MAKINHNNHLNTIDTLFSDAKQRGVLHLVSSAGLVAGRKIQIDNKEHLNFGSLGYLGLELDDRLKESAIDYISKYGTQSVMSRTYISTSIINELEELLGNMFGRPAIVYSRASATHISLIPTLIERKDAIILDQQAHFSMQSAAQLQRQKGVTIDMVKHNNLEMLERKIKELKDTHDKIWYLADGVYSMFGDVAPMQELQQLVKQYPQLHLYVDDCHGMSWRGKNGSGYVLEQVEMNDNLVLVSTMAKGFGVHGGIAILPNDEMYRKVKIFGGPLSYSLPMSPADIGAAVASAKIHLSDEIYMLQHELRERMKYCNKLLDESGLPVISNPNTPIYFVGMGQPRLGYNMVSRLLQEGIYLNPSFFPMVPVKSTGLRFGLTNNLAKQDIKTLVDAIVYHFPKALEEEGRTENQVRKAFNLPLKSNEEVEQAALNYDNQVYSIQHETDIYALDPAEWDRMMADKGTVDWEGMKFMQEVFSNNEKPEENWDFHYYIVRDSNRKPVVATFFTLGLSKDDFIALSSVSKQIERKREKDPYYLTSKTLTSGSMISVGEHLYINRKVKGWRKALNVLFDDVLELQDKVDAKTLMFGQFDAEDEAVRNVFLEQGFLRIDMPNLNVVEGNKWQSYDELLNGLSKRNRKNLRQDVLRFEDSFTIEVKNEVSFEEALCYYNLFQNVKQRNYGLNFFDYPVKIMEKMSEHPNWEFIVLKLKSEETGKLEPVSVVWSYRSKEHYSPMFIGMDYKYLESHKLYKQSVFQILKRSKNLGLEKVYLGFSADTEKRKFGAAQIPTVSYMQTKDNFNIELIESMGVMEELV